MASLKIVMAQINPLVGDIHGNTALITVAIDKALAGSGADIVVFPELTLTGFQGISLTSLCKMTPILFLRSLQVYCFCF